MIQDLPAELLLEVFDCLCQQEPSEQWLYERPHPDALAARIMRDRKHMKGASPSPSNTNLKSISCINRQWRALVLPSLFRNIVWKPSLTSSKLCHAEITCLLDFLVTQKLNHHVKAFKIMLDQVSWDHERPQLYHHTGDSDLNFLWNEIFSVIDPLRFTIIAPPVALATLLCRDLNMADAWSFDAPLHILSWARAQHIGTGRESGQGLSSKSKPITPEVCSPCQDRIDGKSADGLVSSERRFQNDEKSQEEVLPSQRSKHLEPPIRPLFLDRPWTSLLLNEGSSLAAYRTYEFYHRRPPSVLATLLGIGEYANNQTLISSTIVDFNYVAVFPLASHVRTLLSHRLRLDRLFIQITPCASDPVLKTEKSVRHIEMADLWLERDTIYRDIFTRLKKGDGEGGWGTVKVLEVEDSTDTEFWDLATIRLDQATHRGWSVERDSSLSRVAVKDI